MAGHIQEFEGFEELDLLVWVVIIGLRSLLEFILKKIETNDGNGMMRILGGLRIWSKCIDFDVLNVFVDNWVSFFF